MSPQPPTRPNGHASRSKPRPKHESFANRPLRQRSNASPSALQQRSMSLSLSGICSQAKSRRSKPRSPFKSRESNSRSQKELSSNEEDSPFLRHLKQLDSKPKNRESSNRSGERDRIKTETRESGSLLLSPDFSLS